jgi:hypothetical protein
MPGLLQGNLDLMALVLASTPNILEATVYD